MANHARIRAIERTLADTFRRETGKSPNDQMVFNHEGISIDLRRVAEEIDSTIRYEDRVP